MYPFDRITAVLDSDLPKHERWVLLVYARYAMKGSAWPSTSTVASQTGLSERAVRSAIRKLEQLGHLRFLHMSKRGTKEYLVDLPAQRAAPRHSVPPPGTTGRGDRHPVPPRPAPRAAKVEEGGREGEDSPPTPSSEGATEFTLLLRALEDDLGGESPPMWWLDPAPWQVKAMQDEAKKRKLPAGRRLILRAMNEIARRA